MKNSIKTLHNKVDNVFDSVKNLMLEVWFLFKVLLIAIFIVFLIVFCCMGYYYYRKFRFFLFGVQTTVKAIETIEMKRSREQKHGNYLPHQINVVSVNAILPHITVRINKKETIALYDCGASVTYCKKSLADKLNLQICPILQPIEARAANNSKINFIGQALVGLEIGEIKGLIVVLISSDVDCPASILIGTDVMTEINKCGIVTAIDFVSKVIQIGDNFVPMVNMITTDNLVFARSLESIKLESRSDNVVDCFVKDKNKGVYIISDIENRVKICFWLENR